MYKKGNLLKKTFWFTFLFLVSIELFAQHHISGKIVDNNHQGLPLVNVAFLAPKDSTLITGSVSDSCGIYTATIEQGKYIVRYSFLGYRTMFQNIHIEHNTELTEVELKSSEINLEGIEVTAYSKPFKILGDGLRVDVEHTILAKQNSLYDILCKIPGIQSRGNAIEVIGRGTPTYYINGRRITNLNELENLDVDQIRSIQLITDTGVRYHSEHRAIIDIKTKRLGEDIAFNVSSNLLQSSNFTQNHRFNGNYNFKNWDFFFSYKYQKGKTKTDIEINQQTANDTLWNSTKLSHQLETAKKHTYTGGFAYHFSPESEISMRYAGEYSKKINDVSDSLAMIPDKGNTAYTNSNSQLNQKTVSHHINIYYIGNWKEHWKINAYGDYIRKTDNQLGSINEKDEFQHANNFTYNRKAQWDIFAANLHLTHDIEGRRNFGIGYDFSHTKGTDYINNVRALNNGKTQNNELKNSVFLTYSHVWNFFSLNVGFRYEHIRTNLKEEYSNKQQEKNYHNFLPSASVSYNKGEFQQNLSYSIHTERPPFDVMNENAIYVDRYTYQKGNLYLKQALTHDLNYMLMYKFLFLNLNYTKTHHPLVTAFYSMPNNSAVTVSYMDNFSSLQNITGMFNLQYPVKWWTPSLTLTCMKSFFNYPGAGGSMLKAGRPITILNCTNSFSLPAGVLLSADFTYGWKGDFQMIEMKDYSSLNLSMKKSFLNDKLRFSLDIYDLFNQNQSHSVSRLNDIIMRYISKEETRKIGLTVIYRFRTEKKMNSQSAARTELSRLNMDEN